MNKINWKRKLTSRKFWAAVVGFVTQLMAMLNVSDNTAVQVTALIMAGGTLIAYIIGEGLTDAANIGAQEGEK
ncbi:MAG: hypothetical protein HDQ95_05830 [Roseburia sp.]|nr:hypothetical protein [Roseburia sp.]